jgi:hypothetical protein
MPRSSTAFHRIVRSTPKCLQTKNLRISVDPEVLQRCRCVSIRNVLRRYPAGFPCVPGRCVRDHPPVHRGTSSTRLPDRFHDRLARRELQRCGTLRLHGRLQPCGHDRERRLPRPCVQLPELRRTTTHARFPWRELPVHPCSRSPAASQDPSTRTRVGSFRSYAPRLPEFQSKCISLSHRWHPAISSMMRRYCER